MNYAPFVHKKEIDLSKFKCHCFYDDQLLNKNCNYCLTNKYPQLRCEDCDDLRMAYSKYIDKYCNLCHLNTCKDCIVYSKCNLCCSVVKVCKKCKITGIKCSQCRRSGCNNCMNYNDYKERHLCNYPRSVKCYLLFQRGF